ncbi:outer membrane lipoprotein-sorting protein [bacterium]|nr:outer membrane lipoprotein-sorting protein [bacterium]NIO19033.1 outer membrane lipoprotein-sorting protein [bacterium]NIO74162.1 outer membrane lipoprotein-sorting protein [bacterium]
MGERINGRGIRVILLALISLVLTVSQVFAQDLSKLLKELEAKYAKFEEEIKDMTTVQEIKVVTPEGEMASEMEMFRKGEKFRMDTTMDMSQAPDMPEGMGEMKTIIIYDGKNTWMISSFTGKKKKLSGEVEKQYQKERNWWELISEKAKIVGTEKVDKRECYVVEIEDKEYPFTRLWLDKRNLVMVKGESKGTEGETILLIHSDFKKIKADWELPYKTEMYADGKLMSTSLVKSLKINKGLSDDLFDPNKVKIQRKGYGMREMMKEMMREEAEERLLEEAEEAIGR